jgi:hypothetical protein
MHACVENPSRHRRGSSAQRLVGLESEKPGRVCSCLACRFRLQPTKKPHTSKRAAMTPYLQQHNNNYFTGSDGLNDFVHWMVMGCILEGGGWIQGQKAEPKHLASMPQQPHPHLVALLLQERPLAR